MSARLCPACVNGRHDACFSHDAQVQPRRRETPMSAPFYSNLKEQSVCGCGCGAIGTLKPPSKDGTRCVQRKCSCPRCRGRRNRKGGLDKQRTAARALGLDTAKFLAGNEENWTDNVWANEVKSGKQCGPVANWWRKVEAQVVANRADVGDRNRPVRAVAMPEDWGKDGLVVVRLSAWRELVAPALAEFYGSDT